MVRTLNQSCLVTKDTMRPGKIFLSVMINKNPPWDQENNKENNKENKNF